MFLSVQLTRIIWRWVTTFGWAMMLKARLGAESQVGPPGGSGQPPVEAIKANKYTRATIVCHPGLGGLTT